jgi:hypothetical protein
MGWVCAADWLAQQEKNDFRKSKSSAAVGQIALAEHIPIRQQTGAQLI